MTETQRPTQEERERAEQFMAMLWYPHEREYSMIVCHKALVAEKEALEERIHSLKGAMMGALAHLDNTQGARDWLLDKLKADDAKAAGEPTITVAQATEREDHERSNGGGAATVGDRPRQPRPDDAPDGANQHDKGAAERTEVTRTQHRGYEAGGSVPLGGSGADDGRGIDERLKLLESRVEDIADGAWRGIESINKRLGEVPDDRASLRRAFVRDKAPVILAGLAADPEWMGESWNSQRAKAIEQAGLIFDETEQSE